MRVPYSFIRNRFASHWPTRNGSTITADRDQYS